MRRPDPEEIVAIGVPMMIEVVAITLFIAVLGVWAIIIATPAAQF